MRNELISAWRRASTAELLWATPNGPRATPVVPLVWPRDRLPCAAVPLSQLHDIESITGNATTGATTTAALSVQTGTETPVTLLATGRIRIEWDLTGERFVEHLLPQEAAKHPPTRLRADSLLARRENWWWLPRVLITLTDTARMTSLPARATVGDALLVRGTRTDPEISYEPSLSVVTTAQWRRPGDGDPVEPWSRDGALLDGNDERVYVFDHRHSPDFERWERWYRSGTLRGHRLYVTAGDGEPWPGDEHAGTAAPFTLPQRLLNHRRTTRACKAGIAEAERQHN